jgi:TonB family protein
MKTFIFVFLFSFLISQAPAESPELKEATDLTNAAVKLFNEQKPDAALKNVKQALEIREKLLPRTDPRVAESLGQAGNLYFATRDYDKAKKTFERLLMIQEERFGPEHLQVADIRYQLGQFYRSRKEYDRALENYKKALTIYGKLQKANTAEFERTSMGFSCVAYERQKPDLLKELDEIQKQFVPGLPTPAELLNGKALSLAKPDWPKEARDLGLQGVVVVMMEIDEQGRVMSAKDLCGGPPYLSESAVQSALRSRFSPTTVSGVPVKFKGVIRYNFVNQIQPRVP